MKKTFSILMAVAMVFAFAGSAMAEAECVQCKDAIPYVYVPSTGGQTVGADTLFDVNGDIINALTGYSGVCPNETPGNLVFDLCSCSYAKTINVGEVLGIKIQIVTPGVYFANDTNLNDGLTGKLRFQIYQESEVDSIACVADASVQAKYFTSLAYYNSSADSQFMSPIAMGSLATKKADVMLVQKAGGFEITPEFLGSNCKILMDIPRMRIESNEYKSTYAGNDIKIIVSAYRETPDATTNDAIAAPVDIALSNNPYNLKIYENTATPRANDTPLSLFKLVNGNYVEVYNIKQVGAEYYEYSTTVTAANTDVDLYAKIASSVTPVLVYTAATDTITGAGVVSAAHLGFTVRQAMYNARWVDTTTICDVQSACSCQKSIAKFGCVANNAMLFPYFTDDTEDSAWANGIAISNLTNTDGTAKIYVYEKSGEVGTGTISITKNSVFLSTLGGIPTHSDVTGYTSTGGDSTPFNEACYIYICTDFNADGFALIWDKVTGASTGYLPRSSAFLTDNGP